ncbi:TRAF-like family protein [Citrus sinensis]|nr:TRAF-like family protein [Citrus sinensis]
MAKEEAEKRTMADYNNLGGKVPSFFLLLSVLRSDLRFNICPIPLDFCNFFYVINSKISSVKRGLPPAHYTLEIKKYSQLSKAVADRYESAIFKTKNESQECNWRLILYPNGNKKGQGTGHISLYLALDESTYFPNNSWEVYVNFTFFVQDRIKNEYLAIRYDDGAVIRLHSMKRECGIDKLIPLQAFKEPSNGYLVDDSCVFGAEIFVIKPTGKGEAVSIVKVPAQAGNILRWKIANFSNLRDPEYCSSEFNAGGREWRIVICPMGDDKDDKAKGNYLSFYVRLQGCAICFSFALLGFVVVDAVASSPPGGCAGPFYPWVLKQADSDYSMKSSGVVSIQDFAGAVVIVFTIFVNEVTWADNAVKGSTLWTLIGSLTAVYLVDGH